jgi:hypothetical protein
MNTTHDSSIDTLDADLGISAAFLSIAETTTDPQRAQSALKAAVKHYNEAAGALAEILDTAGMEAEEADYLRERLNLLALRARRLENRWVSH